VHLAQLPVAGRAAKAQGLEASDFIIDGGLSSDKKVSAANLMNGRGMRIQVEACISRTVLRRVLDADEGFVHAETEEEGVHPLAPEDVVHAEP
jgi:hypothetical protein